MTEKKYPIGKVFSYADDYEAQQQADKMTPTPENKSAALLALTDIENAFDIKVGGDASSWVEDVETIRQCLMGEPEVVIPHAGVIGENPNSPTPPTSQNKAALEALEYATENGLSPEDMRMIRTALMGVSPQVERVTVDEFIGVLSSVDALAFPHKVIMRRFPNGLIITDNGEGEK